MQKKKDYFYFALFQQKVPGVAQWLRRCATSRTVPVSISDVVTGFFSDIVPSDQTMVDSAPSEKNTPGGKGGRCVRLTTYSILCRCQEIWET